MVMLPVEAREGTLWLTPVNGRRGPIATGKRLRFALKSPHDGAMFDGQFGGDLQFRDADGGVKHAYAILCPQTPSGQMAPGETAPVLILLTDEDQQLRAAPAGQLVELSEGPVLTGLLQLGDGRIPVVALEH